MHIKEIVLEGFKSYAQRTVISGWDSQFNAVTGFNGSGKSNILDAICFVLGLTNLSHVRASNLQDLVYKRGQAGIQKASVSIIFDNTNKDTSPIGYVQFDEIVVTRQVVVGGKNKYIVNGHTTQQHVIQNLFQSVQLNVNNPHFLIMQGKITKVLNMKPIEILAMVEEAAGTRMFEERKEKAFKTIAKKEKKLEEIQSLLQEEIIPKLNKLRSERTAYLEFQQLAQDMERTERRVIQLEYNQASSIRSNGESLRQAQQSILADLDDKLAHWELERNRLHDREIELAASMSSSRFSNLQHTFSDIQKKIAQLETQISLKQNAIDEESSTMLTLYTQRDRSLNALEEAEARHATGLRTIDRVEQLLEDKSREVTNLQDRISALSMPGAVESDASAAAAKQIKEEKTLLVSLAVERESLMVRIRAVDQHISRIEPDIAQNKSSMKALSNDWEKAKIEVATLEKSLSMMESNVGENSESKVNQLRTKKQSMQREIEKLAEERDSVYAKIAHIIGFDYTDPSPNFDRSQVHGTVASLIDIKSEHCNKATALEMAAGGKLQNVVVDTEDVGSQLLNKGRFRKRVTLIPLNKIEPTVATEAKVHHALKLAPNKIQLALDLVHYDPTLMAAMKYVFGNTFVCQDGDTANRVTFDQQVKSRSVTWAGDIYEPSGVLSGGYKPQSSGLLLNVMRYRELEKTIQRLHEQINEIFVELAKVEKSAVQVREISDQLDFLRQRRDHFAERLENGTSVDVFSDQLREARQNKADLEARLADLGMREKRTGDKVQELEQEVQSDTQSESNQLHVLQTRLKSSRKEQTKATQIATQAKVDVEAIVIEVEETRGELQNVRECTEETKNQIQVLENELNALSNQLTEYRQTHSNISEELVKLRREQSSFDTNRADIIKQLKQVTIELSNLQNQRKEQLAKLTQLRRDVESALDSVTRLEAKHPWLTHASQQMNGNGESMNLDREQAKLNTLRNRYQQLKRNVNINVMEMIDVAERREIELQEKLATVLRDKNKIEETIDKLDQIKEEELNKTWTKVNKDFGDIFADLLPGGNSATLSPVHDNRILSGLEIRVRLGRMWKDSLTELSGGQRSLIALSLVLALLQFKPAPMYILDEVDAALDLSHTQNIGQLIKSRFTNSQFIVVSLKEGMFSNAHVIFKTRFRDGTSTVERIKGTPLPTSVGKYSRAR